MSKTLRASGQYSYLYQNYLLILNNQEQEILYGNRHPYFEEGVRIAAILGLLFHTALIFYFLYLNVTEMVFFNVLSVILYAISTFLIRRNKSYAFKIFAICSAEVVAHAFLGVYFLGIGSGLNLFVWLIIVLISLSSRTSNYTKISVAALVCIIYVIMLIFGLNNPPVYTLNNLKLEYLNQFVNLACFIVMVMIAFYYSKIIKHKEAIILREVHHRILNNLQLLSSITKLQMYSKENSQDDFQNILSKMDAIKSVHRNVRFKGHQLTVELSNIISDLIEDKENIKISFGNSQQCDLTLEESIPLGLLIQDLIQLYNFKTLQIKLTTNTRYKIEILFEYHDISRKEGQDESMEIVKELVEQVDGSCHIQHSDPNSSFLLKV